MPSKTSSNNIKVENIFKEIKNRPLTPEEKKLIEKAFNFSKQAHKDQKRKTGEPYFYHCYFTALKTAQWQLDSETIAAAFLHDVAEDTKYSLADIEKNFSKDIAHLVNGVTKISRIKYKGQEKEKGRIQTQAENIRKLILALSKDLRVILIKLADRLHNMKTLQGVSPIKRKRIALETFEIYAPLAYRLGMANLAGELEDLSFPYLYPDKYKWLIENVKEKYEQREQYLRKVKQIIEKELQKHHLKPIKIDFRAKRYASLYKKLLRYDMNLDQIYDLVALRIIVSTIEECYSVLGIIHSLWPPLPGRIKDYIAMPKPNGYRSLHTTVFCLDNKPTEFQIRTLEMHQEAENGIAAHWAYHESKKTKTYLKKQPSPFSPKDLLWVQQLRNWQQEFSSSEEFLESLKIDFLKDRIFVITPKGEVLDLPHGSCPVDFAYAIHTEIGNQCIGAKVNNKMVPLDCQLQSGDLVEIITQKNKKPSESWLEFVKTANARKNIKKFLKEKLAPELSFVELKMIVEDKMGLLKTISSIISKHKVNIRSVHSSPYDRKHHLIKIQCETNKEKAEKIVLKLKKKLKEIKEIHLS